MLVLVNRARYHFATMQTMRTTYAVYGYMYAWTRSRTYAHRIRVARADNVARSIFHRRAHSSARNFIFNPQPYERTEKKADYRLRCTFLLPSRELRSRVLLSFRRYTSLAEDTIPEVPYTYASILFTTIRPVASKLITREQTSLVSF